MHKLSEAEENALEILKLAGGGMLITQIPEKTYRNMFGQPEPGLAIYKKLEKKGLVYFTEEEPCFLDLDPTDALYGFEFTPSVYLVTD